MKTKIYTQNKTKALIAFMSAAMMAMSFTACTQDDELADLNSENSLTRGQTQNLVTYVERSWNGREVQSNVKVVSDYTELKGSLDSEVIRLEAGQWYVVKTNSTFKVIYAPKSGAAANLIICDGVTLNARINIDENQSLNIYGQEHDSGKLNANPFSLLNEKDDDGVMRQSEHYPCIGSRANMGTLTIHGGTISAECKDQV